MAETILTPEDAEEYTQSLEQVAAGAWRQIALGIRMRVPEALGLSRDDWGKRLGNRVRLPVEERQQAVAELQAEGMNNSEIADALGVDETTVRRDIDSANAELEPELATNIEPDSANAELTTRELLAQSDQNDWRTPRKFLDAARGVLGGIDLDPASSAEANETVQASRFYTEEEDGLNQPWKGTVWLNPPYGGQARLFIERLLREYQVGNVTAACSLVNSHPTETKWFQELFRYTICFVRGRIDFGGPSREVASTSTHGSAIVYLGEDVEGFTREFKQFGAVVRAL